MHLWFKESVFIRATFVQELFSIAGPLQKKKVLRWYCWI